MQSADNWGLEALDKIKPSTAVRDIVSKYVGVKVDRSLLRKVLEFNDSFRNRDEDSINFFGGNLIGVYMVKFVDEHQVTWIEDILEIDDFDGMRQEIHDVEGIVGSRYVSGSPVNISFVWLAHMAMNSRALNHKDQERLATAAIDMLQYKYLSSIHNHFYKYPINIGLSMAIYESLDRKSALKRHGTWGAVLTARTEDILSKKSIHFDVVDKMGDTLALVYMLNDIQGRLKSIIKKLTDIFYKLREEDAKIQSSGKFIQLEGEQHLKESTNQYERMRNRIKDVMLDRNDFVNEELMDVILGIADTANKRNLEETLFYLSDNITGKRGPKLIALVEDIIIYTFDVIRKEKISLDRAPEVTFKLLTMFRSSRVTGELIHRIREDMAKEVENAIGNRATSVIASTRIAVILYIVVRALMAK